MSAEERLRRRWERERSARMQAELIAESRLREFYDQQRELDLIARVATAANDGSDPDAVYAEVLPLLVAHGGWMTGHVLSPTSDDPAAVTSSGVWYHVNAAAGDRIQAATTGRRFGPDEGLPGRAIVRGPVWEPDFATSTVFLRRADLPQGSACAFPVLAGRDVVAVMELLSLVPRAEDPRFLRVCGLIGTTLGRVAERARSARAQQQARHALESEVTERTRDLVAARRAVQAQARTRLSFHAALSHELGTPLHALGAALADLAPGEEEGPLPPDSPVLVARTALAALTERAARLLRNADVDDVVDPPRVVAPAEALAPSLAALRRIVGDTARTVRFDEDPTALAPVYLDESALVRATESVLTAALLATDSGDLRVTCHVSATTATVSVQCPGILPAVPDLARQAVEAADGEARMVVTAGGSEVVVTVPCVAPHSTRRGVVDRVLLVDDTSVMRQLCAAMIQSLGHPVDTVTNGAEALAALAANEYGLVLMDLSMPIMDGWEAARLLRAGHSGPTAATTPVVALTAHTSGTHLVRSRLAGMDEVLTKPFTKDQLAAVIQHYLP